MRKWVKSANNDAREMEFGLGNGGDDGGFTSVGLMKISKTFVMQIFLWDDAVWQNLCDSINVETQRSCV